MKKTLPFIIITLLFISVTVTFAQTVTPSPNPTSQTVTEKLSSQINNLKEKIASRVAQLKLVEKRGIIGSVKEVNGTQIVLTDLSNNNRGIDVDEITKFSSPSAKESFGISDIKPGMKISVVGLYNKDSERLLARFVSAYTTPLYLSGVVTDLNKTDFTLNLAMEEGKNYLVDIENITKTMSYSGETSEKSGFTKIEKGTRVVIVGYPDKKEKNRMVATRILLFPVLPKNPKIAVVPNAVDSDKAVTSSGSGKKLTPIK